MGLLCPPVPAAPTEPGLNLVPGSCLPPQSRETPGGKDTCAATSHVPRAASGPPTAGPRSEAVGVLEHPPGSPPPHALCGFHGNEHKSPSASQRSLVCFVRITLETMSQAPAPQIPNSAQRTPQPDQMDGSRTGGGTLLLWTRPRGHRRGAGPRHLPAPSPLGASLPLPVEWGCVPRQNG